jgi:hypothetical protein
MDILHLQQNAIEYIMNHAEVTVCFIQDSKLLGFDKALPRCKDRLKAIVYWPTGAGIAESMWPQRLPVAIYVT